MEAYTDKEAEFLYRTTAAELYRLALYSLLHPEDAEQAACSSFATAFKKTLDKADAARFWDLSIRLLYQYGKRTEKEAKRRADTYFGNHPAEEVRMSAEKKELFEALRGLSFEERYTLLLFLSKKHSMEQLADILGLTQARAKKQLCAAMKKVADLTVQKSGGRGI